MLNLGAFVPRRHRMVQSLAKAVHYGQVSAGFHHPKRLVQIENAAKNGDRSNGTVKLLYIGPESIARCTSDRASRLIKPAIQSQKGKPPSVGFAHLVPCGRGPVCRIARFVQYVAAANCRFPCRPVEMWPFENRHTAPARIAARISYRPARTGAANRG